MLEDVVGYSASWFAVRGVSRDAVLTAFQWQASGVRTQYPEFQLCMAELPQEWLLVWFDDDFERAFREVAVLPPHGTVVACAVEEHVMESEARGYADGVETWRVTHDPDRGESLYHLETSGNPPTQLARILADAKAAQAAAGGEEADVDMIFDVPVDLAKSICGFKHNDDPPEGAAFEQLRRAKASAGKPGFLARLFGAR